MSRGQQLLLLKTAAHGAGKVIADLAGVEPNQISQWRQGLNKPSGPNRVLLEKVGIPPASWEEPPEAEAPATKEPAA